MTPSLGIKPGAHWCLGECPHLCTIPAPRGETDRQRPLANFEGADILGGMPTTFVAIEIAGAENRRRCSGCTWQLSARRAYTIA